jgi:hypothetical protein
MKPIRRLALAVTAVSLIGFTACAPITVTSFTERGVDPSTYRTFAWDPTDTAVPGDPRLDNNPFFHEYVREAIDLQLIMRGYERSGLQPDLRVHYHASSRQKTNITGLEPTTQRCRDCAVEVYDEGTLLIDLTDARTGTLVWRGVAKSGLAGVVDNQTKMEETIERVVARIFAKLPRRS